MTWLRRLTIRIGRWRRILRRPVPQPAPALESIPGTRALDADDWDRPAPPRQPRWLDRHAKRR